MERLALKYRPKSLQDVIGQEYPKRIIAQLILNNQSCANLLLHGSVGSGKTTLVRIYAGALNCQSPTATGDRCFVCDRCRALDSGDNAGFIELDTPKFRDLAGLKAEIDRVLEAAAAAGRRTVIFLDEAHVLSRYRDSFDFLLKKVEEPPPGVSFCFATTAVERMSEALRSRTIQLEVRPLTHAQSVGLLTRTAKDEGLTLHTEAISLLAGLGEHQPRNMLQALDKMRLLSDGTEITRDRVAAVFGVDYIEHLIQYFEALGAGDLRRQTESFLQWSDGIRNKVRLIQLFLVGFYYIELCGLDVSVDPVVASIRLEERQRVKSAFAGRLPDIDLTTFFEGLLGVWPVVTVDLSDEALLAILLRFQMVANRSAPMLRPETSVARIRPERIVEADIGGDAQRRVTTDDDAKAPKDPAYLNRSHVRSIFAAASFLVQQGYPSFNARITIRHRLFGHQDQAAASDHFKAFSSALKLQLVSCGGSGLRIFVQERDEAEGSCGRVIAHVSDVEKLGRWMLKWHRSSRLAGAEDRAVTMDIGSAGRRLDEHWRCVRWLCGGFNPADPIHSKIEIEPDYHRVAGDIGKRNRQDQSEALDAAARIKADEKCGIDLLSAFNDRKWDRLYDGWELDEQVYREQRRSQLEAAMLELRARHALDSASYSDEMRGYEEAELRSNLAASAVERAWAIWDRS
ncbi:AAA family ATPase [Tardiphaga alba]|uniref:AAA family ATPase n=1 Tax=Tardiphaga alba TaxID=340268 RepID=UPI001BAC5801|nr:AAA family ATPase [Tardiphaga alba]